MARVTVRFYTTLREAAGETETDDHPGDGALLLTLMSPAAKLGLVFLDVKRSARAIADIIRRAMVRMPAALDTVGLKSSRMLLQVHDELLFESPASEVDELIAIVREEMEGAIELDVPLRVDVGSGDSWYASKGG